MELTVIGAEELERLYEERLREDFPADELRPYSNMKYLLDRGLYRCLVCHEEGKLLGYALFVLSGAVALLDYYAVVPELRDRGVGSRFFRSLKRPIAESGASLVLIEAESVESAVTPSQTEERERRFRFYERCGCRKTQVCSYLFGVEYRIFVCPLAGEDPPDREVMGSLEELYRRMIPPIVGEGEEAFRKVCRCYLQEEKRPREFVRELGRALTCLNRSRKRFMGEHLREYGFSGAMYSILLYVDRHPGTTQDSIATHMYVDKSNVARRIKQLEELSHIRRETDAADRRQNNLYLTDKGKEMIPLIKTYLSQWGQTVAADLTEEERSQLLTLLFKMTGQDEK